MVLSAPSSLRHGNGSVVENKALDREVQHLFAGSHQRAITLLGWTCGQTGLCAKALRRRRQQRWKCRQLCWKEAEKDLLAGPHPKRFKSHRREDTAPAETPKACGNADSVAESVKQSTGWPQFAQDRWHGWWLRHCTQFGGLHRRQRNSSHVQCRMFAKRLFEEMF